MSEFNVKKTAVAFGLLSFAIMVMGSIFSGSLVFTAVFRGVVASLVFGGLTWFVGSFAIGDEVPEIEDEPVEIEEKSETQKEEVSSDSDKFLVP